MSSSYVQQLSWNVLAETEKTTSEEDYNRGVEALLAQCSALFEEQLKGLTAFQMNFLRALCDGVTTDFGSKAILEKYNLGSKSNISRIKAALQDKEMIDFDKDSVYLEDPVFKIFQPSIRLVFVEKLTPILYIVRPSCSKGLAYCLASICWRASSALLSSLNSII